MPVSKFPVLLLLLSLACKTMVQAQATPVHEEPRHPPVFQDRDIRILNARIPPGDTSQYHIHSTPSLFIFFTSTNNGSQLQGKPAIYGKSTAGHILFENLAAPNIRIHRVWNHDMDTFHVMDIELLYKDPGFVRAPLNLPHLKLEIDTAWIRAYRLTLPKGNDFTAGDIKRSFVLVSISASTIQTKQGGKVQDQMIKPGSFFEIKREDSFYLKNTSDNTVQLVLIELPEN